MGKKYELIPSDKEGLYRIKALKDFNDVKKGDLGGYVEGEKTLSQLGNCWIYDNAVVRDNAKVRHNAQIYDKAIVMGNAEVCDNVQIFDNAFVLDNVHIWDNARICDNARVCDNARIGGHAVVQHDAVVRGEVCIWDDAIISSDKDYIVFKNWWSSGRYFTWTRSNNMWKVGCFYGTGDELIAKAYKDSVESGREYKKIVDYVESILENQRSNYE